MICPSCSSEMREESYEDVLLDFCPGCGGAWSSAEELGKVALTQKMEFSGDEALSALREDWQAKRPKRELLCPVCADPMEEFDYLDLGVRLDRCVIDHGIYFDRLELEKIQILIERGTMGFTNKVAAPVGGPKRCPHCGINLSPKTYEGVNIDECAGCGGIWTETGELGGILERREKAFSTAEKSAAEYTSAPARSETAIPRILCPVCKDLMERLTYAHDTDILIDKCAHGVWLDKGEIDRIQAYIEGSEALKDSDNEKWGSIIRQTKDDILRERDNAIESMKWSRFGVVNKLLRAIADRVME